MMEPRSTATIRALASLAELSANQLEEGVSVEDVVATLRKAAEAVRHVVEEDERASDEQDVEIDLVQELTPMDIGSEDEPETESDDPQDKDLEEPVLNAG